MICPHCGADNPADNRYCGQCGGWLTLEPDSEHWSKEIGIPGWMGRVTQSPEGAQVETHFSLLGYKETRKYPRWMVTWPIAIFIGVTLFLTFLILERAAAREEFGIMGFGLILLGFCLLVLYVVYKVYYAPPRRK